VRRSRWERALGCAALGLVGLFGWTVPAAPQALGFSGPPEDAEAFLEGARAAAERFRDRDEAIRRGYRRLGPDFPGMGEHWIHPGILVRGVLDPEVPGVLCFVERDGRAHLVGLAYALPLGPHDDPPERPFGREVWHDHVGAVDEEVLLLNHPSTHHGGGDGHRLTMVHVWMPLENPDGILAQNNWALPFWRLGLEAPGAPSPEAARGVSLARGGRDYYAELLRRAAPLSPREEAAVDEAIRRHADRAERAVDAALATGGRVDRPEEFAEIWGAFWDEVRAGVGSGAWEGLRPLSGVAGGHRHPG
jgi:hypothetical protein